MATIKSYTDLSQSKALAKILPLESADMMYHSVETEYGSGAFVATSKVITNGLKNDDFYVDDIPCWSLAALINVLPNNEHITTSVSRGSWQLETIEYMPNTWWCEYEDSNSLTEFNVSADNPVDACVTMIEKLHELKML